jgi:hypothetical protein
LAPLSASQTHISCALVDFSRELLKNNKNAVYFLAVDSFNFSPFALINAPSSPLIHSLVCKEAAAAAAQNEKDSHNEARGKDSRLSWKDDSFSRMPFVR